ATTFIAATQYSSAQDVPFGGHMAVASVSMESPAVIMAVGSAAWVRRREGQGAGASVGGPAAHGASSGSSASHILKEAFTDGANSSSSGSSAIGWVTGDQGKSMMEPFSGASFKGMSALFSLDSGSSVARHSPASRQTPPASSAYGVSGP
ncbi:hypothetical protein OY671_011908, partial [Metschnikowia pulcherrima]